MIMKIEFFTKEINSFSGQEIKRVPSENLIHTNDIKLGEMVLHREEEKV